MRGTWKTSGPDLSGLIGAAAAVGAAWAVAEIILRLIWYIAAFAAAVLAGTVISAVALRCRTGKHAAELEATLRARQAAVAAAAAARRELPAAAPISISQHVHYHYHAAPDSPARVVIPALAEDVTTEGNRQPRLRSSSSP